jgi:hypothetical protein
MAIQKTKTLPSGVSGNYWRILSITLDTQSGIAVGRIGLFINQATSDAGGEPLPVVKSFSFSFTAAGLLAAPNVISYVYTNIMNMANTMITKSITGATLQTPIPYDADLAGGTVV